MEAGRRRSGRPSHPTFRKPSRCASQPTAARICEQIRQKPTVLASEYCYVCLASINTSSPSPAAIVYERQSSQLWPPDCSDNQPVGTGLAGWAGGTKAADISTPIPTVAHPLLGRSLLQEAASLGSAFHRTATAPPPAYLTTVISHHGRIAPNHEP